MKNRKLIGLLIALFAAGILLAGCASGGSLDEKVEKARQELAMVRQLKAEIDAAVNPRVLAVLVEKGLLDEQDSVAVEHMSEMIDDWASELEAAIAEYDAKRAAGMDTPTALRDALILMSKAAPAPYGTIAGALVALVFAVWGFVKNRKANDAAVTAERAEQVAVGTIHSVRAYLDTLSPEARKEATAILAKDQEEQKVRGDVKVLKDGGSIL